MDAGTAAAVEGTDIPVTQLAIPPPPPPPPPPPTTPRWRRPTSSRRARSSRPGTTVGSVPIWRFFAEHYDLQRVAIVTLAIQSARTKAETLRRRTSEAGRARGRRHPRAGPHRDQLRVGGPAARERAAPRVHLLLEPTGMAAASGPGPRPGRLPPQSAVLSAQAYGGRVPRDLAGAAAEGDGAGPGRVDVRGRPRPTRRWRRSTSGSPAPRPAAPTSSPSWAGPRADMMVQALRAVGGARRPAAPCAGLAGPAARLRRPRLRRPVRPGRQGDVVAVPDHHRRGRAVAPVYPAATRPATAASRARVRAGRSAKPPSCAHHPPGKFRRGPAARKRTRRAPGSTRRRRTAQLRTCAAAPRSGDLTHVGDLPLARAAGIETRQGEAGLGASAHGLEAVAAGDDAARRTWKVERPATTGASSGTAVGPDGAPRRRSAPPAPDDVDQLVELGRQDLGLPPVGLHDGDGEAGADEARGRPGRRRAGTGSWPSTWSSPAACSTPGTGR